jgi:hypothetical protein
VLGLAWWAWQLPLFIAYGDSFAHGLLLIVPQTILMTWLVNGTGGSMIIALLSTPGWSSLSRRCTRDPTLSLRLC